MPAQKTVARLVALFVIVALAPAPVFGGAQKLKNKRKEKRFEPVVKQDSREYVGRYVGLEDYYLEIRAGADGALSVISREGARRAMLRDIQLTGARLTATRVYPDGTTKEFTGTFVNRVLNDDVRFGIMVENVEVQFEGLTLNNIFYRLDAQQP